MMGEIEHDSLREDHENEESIVGSFKMFDRSHSWNVITSQFYFFFCFNMLRRRRQSLDLADEEIKRGSSQLLR